MKTISKSFVFFVFFYISGSCALAFSPFDTILERLPDIAVTNIHQETSYVYMQVCNLWGGLMDSDTSLVLAMKKTGWGIVSMVEPIILGTNECHEFRVASIQDLGIHTSGIYEISAGALLKDGKVEKAKDNNKVTQSINITYPSKYSQNIQIPTYYPSNNYNNGTTYCNVGNNYCSNSTTYYCIPGTNNCSTLPYSTNNTYYCNANNNYCANSSYNGWTIYHRANICPPNDYICNQSYYNSTNTQYRDAHNRNCTYSNNYCNNYHDNVRYEIPDLIVQKIYQNISDKRIVAQIYNNGGEMQNNASIRTNFTVNDITRTIYNTIQIGRGQCTSDIVSITPEELGIHYNGNYALGINIDTNNNLSESNESNNTLSQNMYIETNRNRNADLVVDRIWANDNNRTLTTRVCNTGDDMASYNNWTVEVSNTSTNTTVRTTGSRLTRWQCLDISTAYFNLWIYRSGSYNFRATADIDNNIAEQSEWNNIMNQNIQVWTNY